MDPGFWLSGPRPAFWGVAPLTLVVVTLLGSVAVPARQTWQITRLLRESTELLAPARLIEAQLQAGLSKELAALQSYALVGDDALLRQFRATAADDERRLAALERLSARLGVVPARHADMLRQRIGDWRQATDALTTPPASRSDLAVTLPVARAKYDAALSAFTELSSDFAAAAASRDDRVRALEHLSLAANAVLVLAALVAMGGVATLTFRERRLTATLHVRVEDARRRARQEAALRAAAEALAGAYTAEEVTRRIAQTALAALEGRGAFVEQIVSRPGEPADVTVVRAAAGAGVPPLETTAPFAGSYTEQVATSGQPRLVADLERQDRPGAAGVARQVGGSAIVVPLGIGGASMGALFVTRPVLDHFRSDDLARAGVFGHLATLAYEKVRLLEDANERRRVLERVMQSRSRLMRGFSHDVKNPIGAADGFADLLCLGVYGQLSAEQRAIVERMRRSLRGALTLIDDLHELARAETGILVLTSEPVNLADLVRTISEEYHGTARAAGLSLSVEVALDLPVIETDRERVRQIVANLLSNAIKYTESGSVLVRASHRPAGSSGEAGDWALVEVVDTGPGIPADKQDVVFEEFSRLGIGEQRGAGLGLAISKLLAQALGGRITVRSVPGQGSTFALWLPLRLPASPTRPCAPADAPAYVRVTAIDHSAGGEMSDETDMGIDAGRGRSPGATGRLFPNVPLATADGRPFSLERYRPRRNLVVLMLGGGQTAPPVVRLLKQLAVAQVQIEAEDGQIVVISANTPEQRHTAWPYAFPLAFDVDATLHRRVAAVDSAGRPDVALFITDRFREIFAALRPRDARWPANARDVVEWLTFVNIQCPECNPPEA